MAQHINYGQHIRKQPEQHIRQQSTMDKATDAVKSLFSSPMKHIRSSPKMMIGTILVIIFIVIVIAAVVGHYMRYWTLPLIPQKELAPASHLQYFFF
jgi:hypothetical protein